MSFIYCISKKEIADFLKYLTAKYDVFAPQKKGGEVVFDEVSDDTDIIFDYETTILPPKKYFLPAEEDLFVVKNQKISQSKTPRPFVIFGLDLKDLEAIAELDEIMNFKFKDDFYFKRRKESVLIAVSNHPVCSPFSGICLPFGGFATPSFGDLILEKIGKDLYAATAFTPFGKKLLRQKYFKKQNVKKFLSKEKAILPFQEKTKKEEQKNNYIILDNLIKDSEFLAKVVEWSWKNYPEIWEELGKKCLGCGNCSYVCPLCYCFDIEDRIISKEKCVRCRKWDACTLPDFNLIAGGYNFHPQIKHRIYNWFYHKFVRGYNEFGRSLCVACGRCKKYCPAGIDIEKVLNKIIKEYNSKNPKS